MRVSAQDAADDTVGEGVAGLPFQTVTTDLTMGTTRVLAPSSVTIVVGAASPGDAEEHKATVLALAEIAMALLDDVTGLSEDG